MNKIIDYQLIRRRANLANIASIGGLFLLLASVLLPLYLSAVANYAWLLTIAGAAVAIYGIYYANRWVRKPRPEEQIDQACRGLSDQFVTFHYPRLPVDHLVLTPGGVVVLETVAYQGVFRYTTGRWHEDMTLGRAARYIVEEHLGDPGQQLAAQIACVRDLLAGAGLGQVPVSGLVLFTHPGAQLELDHPPVPVVSIAKFKKAVSKVDKKLSPEVHARVQALLEERTVGRG